ncbi:MAG TPA: molybdopterin-dependent oxidoreductase [Tepidisphaeraceae bacterium]|nr:molybdopterin-dependent oxidoreductase [Tepidisphaeraceae bacterium]
MPSHVLSITGEVPQPLEMDAQTFSELPAKQVIVKDRAGHAVTYRGPLLRDVLSKAGVVIGNDPSHGHRAPLCVLVIASDGYKSIFSLSELDPSLRDRPIILANQRDGQQLDSKEGPLRLIVADESKPERWIRQVSTIKVVAMK